MGTKNGGKRCGEQRQWEWERNNRNNIIIEQRQSMAWDFGASEAAAATGRTTTTTTTSAAAQHVDHAANVIFV